jgi:hypothetical protein
MSRGKSEKRTRCHVKGLMAAVGVAAIIAGVIAVDSPGGVPLANAAVTGMEAPAAQSAVHPAWIFHGGGGAGPLITSPAF